MSSYKKLPSIDAARRRLLFHSGTVAAAGAAGARQRGFEGAGFPERDGGGIAADSPASLKSRKLGAPAGAPGPYALAL